MKSMGRKGSLMEQVVEENQDGSWAIQVHEETGC